ncbi:MAG: energy transducer TonB [Flavobacteriales bacterium]|nr:energy transducer TonB [Flavobacteriales bacterium]
MLVKKSKKARLSPHRKLFFQLGLILSLSLIYIALEWKTVDRNISDFQEVSIQSEEFIEIPITQRILVVKPPPPPPAPERIKIVTNDENIIETVLESTETDETEFVEVQEYEDIEEIIEEEDFEKDIPFAIIEEAPVFPGCRGSKDELKQCLQDKINRHVLKNFNTELAQELGLTVGKKKVYVQFKIDKTGKIVNIRARGPHTRLEKEAIRVVELLPQMTPGRQRTKPVGVSYTLPITLQVLE